MRKEYKKIKTENVHKTIDADSDDLLISILNSVAHLLLSSASTPLGSEYNLLESSSKSLSQSHFSVEYSLQVCHRYVDNRCYHKNNKVQRYIYITFFAENFLN